MPGVFQFSQTAADNATAVPSINWAENQAPSSINDSSRAEMAAVACYRDDISGSILTSGTSNAYILSSNQQFDKLTNMHQKEIWFTPHITNIAGSPDVTITIDGFANIPIRSAPNTPLVSGVLIAGTPFGAIYNNSDGALYLKGYFGNFGIPFLGGMDFWDTVTPASNFIFPMGQAISRTTFAKAFARWGTTFGAGDGSTTFNVPDKTGRVSAMQEATATRLTSRYFGGNSTVLGATGGLESETLTLAQLPTGITSAGTFALSTNNFLTAPTTGFGITQTNPQSGGAVILQAFAQGVALVAANPTASGTVTSNNTSGNAHNNVPPTIVCNYIIRII